MSRFAPSALMFGNFVTGASVLAPAGMLAPLAEAFGVSIRDAGLLITFGAVVLCLGSPLTAWLTSRFDRRALLGATLLVFALGNLASAFAPDYAVLLIVRLVMLSVGALYTPQAAGTAALIVPPDKRGGVITYVFLGWSLAVALGLPMVTWLASQFGWRGAYAGVGLLGLISCALLVSRLPSGLRVAPVDLRTWGAVGRNGRIMTLLGVTILQTSGQFALFTFLGPLLVALGGAGTGEIAVVFALYGTFGFVGNVIASRVVDRLGGLSTSALSIGAMLTGAALWSLGAGSLPAMTIAVVVWGLGFAATNSMQQVRLVAADPQLAGATVSLNTSTLYVGQAIGSGLAGALFAAGLLQSIGYAAVALLAAALAVVIGATRERPVHRPA